MLGNHARSVPTYRSASSSGPAGSQPSRVNVSGGGKGSGSTKSPSMSWHTPSVTSGSPTSPVYSSSSNHRAPDEAEVVITADPNVWRADGHGRAVRALLPRGQSLPVRPGPVPPKACKGSGCQPVQLYLLRVSKPSSTRHVRVEATLPCLRAHHPRSGTWLLLRDWTRDPSAAPDRHAAQAVTTTSDASLRVWGSQ